MSDASPDTTTSPAAIGGGGAEVASPVGMNPYATGGGGVTFERKVAAQYLAHLLAGDAASELGDGRSVVSVEFQQSPDHPVDDLVVNAACPDESLPSLVLALAVRRSPKLVLSDESTRKLIRQFVRGVIDAPMGERQYRMGLIVAGPRRHAQQLAKLADLAAVQMDASGFSNLLRTSGKFDTEIRRRLDQLEKLVERALQDLGVASADATLVQQRTWELLARLTVSMPRLESPDETDWGAVANSLIPVARGSDPMAAARLRDRLVTLASEYSPKSARVDLTLLRRDAHAMLDPTTRRHQRGWQALDLLHTRALSSVRDEITSIDGARRVRLDRNTESEELLSKAANAAAVVVSGESGVGKSTLAVRGLTAAGETAPDGVQALCINLRHVPKLTVQFQDTLGCPLSTLLGELSAPQRMLIVDAADAVTEGREDAFRYLVDAAQESDVKVVAITSVDNLQVVRDTLAELFGPHVAEFAVKPLSDADIGTIVKTFAELSVQNANPRSRELLRRLVVIDLLVRAGARDVPLTDADTMQAVWSRLVRRREMFDRGAPDARESVLLKMAALALSDAGKLETISGFDPSALAGLRRDGLLRTSDDARFTIGPEFTHDEVRRYAVAGLLLSDGNPAARIMQAGAPRWSLSAAQLACQALLAEPDAAATPLQGRFAALQASFDALVDAGHGARWGDVPAEALLALADPGPVLQHAWPGLLSDDSAGLRRFARLIDQRHRGDNRIVDVIAIEPIVTLLLDDHAPWRRFGKHAENLLREWLYGHVVANTCEGHPLRIRLRDRLLQECAVGDRRLAKEQKAEATRRAARTPEEVERESRLAESQSDLFAEYGFEGRRRRQRPDVPREIQDSVVLELLSLLGPDLGDSGEAILRRVALEAPSWLAPALEEHLAGRALASYSHRLLAQLTQAYYFDDDVHGSRFHDDGIRRHQSRSIWIPFAAWYRGPFMPLFQTDFRGGVAVLNRLLNHAARIRARKLARLGRSGQPLEDDAIGQHQAELEIAGARQRYIGDGNVWLWYRGTGVGPYPCISALQALERVCDQLIENEVPIETVVSILLDGCENLAIPSLVVGILVRHLENADHLLDTYLTEPLIWHHEFSRVAHENTGFAPGSEGVVAPERRKWSLREAAMFMAMRASEERVTGLRALGGKLVANARRHLKRTRHDDEPMDAEADADDFSEHTLVAQVRAWASSLDRDTYQVHEAPDGLYVQAAPPEDIVQALESSNEDLSRAQEATRLTVRYYVEPRKESIRTDDLARDIETARKLLENPPSLRAHDPWDTPALVAAAALEAHLLSGAILPEHALSFAADTVLRIGEGEAWPRQYESEETVNEQGADRSAARALPLLFLPVAASLRALIDGADGTPLKRAISAGLHLARAVANEVRLDLARGLDHVWKTPCAEDGECHHEMGLRLVTETMHHCILSTRARRIGRRTGRAFKKPLTKSLAKADARSIVASRLDAAIRALAPAAVADICVSPRAHDLLLVLFGAHRRSLLIHEHGVADDRGWHSLVSARALLTLAEHGENFPIYEHIEAYADNSALLGNLLRGLSASAEETEGRAAAARRIWPTVVRRVLALNDSGHSPFQDRHYGDVALAALMPNLVGETAYLYREFYDEPIAWWEPLAMQPEVEAWLTPAAGRASCVDHLIGFLRVLAHEDQVRTGLPWVSKLVLAAPAHAASHSFVLTDWLIESRTAAVDIGLLVRWQEVVDGLVVAGVTRLAPYSE